MSLQFVNYRGEPVAMTAVPKPKKTAIGPTEWHKGWRVVGIPPGALEEAKAQHEREAAATRAKGKEPKVWDEANWLMNARKKPVRGKPYEVPEAAHDCKRLAEGTGWLAVEVVELKSA